MDDSTDRFPCPCCGHLTFGESPGSYEICNVCYWEDDALQLRWPEWGGAANTPSLIDAQRAYAVLGAAEARLVTHVRPPTSSESIDTGWRPIDPGLDDFERRGRRKRRWPEDLTVLYWWRPTYWRRR
nr:CPCC family cysteine-rich protein [Cellulosimicrobium sp. Marseille-Q4280]